MKWEIIRKGFRGEGQVLKYGERHFLIYRGGYNCRFQVYERPRNFAGQEIYRNCTDDFNTARKKFKAFIEANRAT